MKNLYILTFLAFFSSNKVFSSPNGRTTAPDSIQLVTNLYVISSNGSPILVDGTFTQYSTEYSNALDGMDARKMTNPGENWGMLRNQKVYIVERRHVIEGSDSVFFKMWNMRVNTYRLELITNNLDFPGRTGVLEDKYLQTSTPISLNGNTEIDFAVNADAASKDPGRFRIIFSNSKASGLLPVDFVFANAVQNNQWVNVTWQTKNTDTLNLFSIEKSSDGIHFKNTHAVAIDNTGENHYHYTDETPVEGDNYYRISSLYRTGKVQYSSIVKVNVAALLPSMTVYPNPATANNLNLKIINFPSGQYSVRLFNSFGQAFIDKKIQYYGGTAIEKLQPAQPIPPGIYQLEILSGNGKRNVISIAF